MDDDKDEDKQRAGQIGGARRAEILPPNRRTEIARNAAAARWNKSIPEATHTGILKIADFEIDCAVLSDSRRVLSQRSVNRALGRSHGGAEFRRRQSEAGGGLPIFLVLKSLQPFISNELRSVVSQPIFYSNGAGGGIAHGIDPSVLTAVCEVWVDAYRAGALQQNQYPTAERARALLKGLQNVGITALVDEATGYQYVRPADDLRRLLEAYVSPEFLPWTKRFPDEFYKELFRLRGWAYDPMSVKRPQLVGYLTENIVYKRLPEGVLAELKKLNPKNESGRRKRKHHQFLTDNIGNPHLEKHVVSAVTLMKISATYKGFKKHLDKVLPIPRAQLALDLDDTEDGDDE
jgi:hypothetical protein